MTPSVTQEEGMCYLCAEALASRRLWFVGERERIRLLGGEEMVKQFEDAVAAQRWRPSECLDRPPSGRRALRRKAAV